MNSANPFTQLGLPQNASVAEVRAAFRKLAKQTHPDKQDGSDSEFIDTVDAYKKAVKMAEAPPSSKATVTASAPAPAAQPSQTAQKSNLNAIIDFRGFLVALGSQLALLLLARMFL